MLSFLFRARAARCLAVCATILAARPADAQTPEPLHAAVDRLVAAGDDDFERKAAPLADDAAFLRRVTIDLADSVPSAASLRAFLADPRPGRRERKIDALVNAPEFARRMAGWLDDLLMDRRAGKLADAAAFREYLRQALLARKPYDALVREILSADGADAARRHVARFYLDRDLDSVVLTRDISRVFLGRNVQCAQCHDHPRIDDYKQEHFYGIQAFLNRSYLYPKADDPKAVIAEKAEGEVTFVSVFDKAKAQRTTRPAVPGGMMLAEPKLEPAKAYTTPAAKDTKPVPAYSRRARLADALTSPENTAFARTAANRVWALLLGRGIVHPLDQDHPDNPPSHPELLDALAKHFVASGYDLRSLVREVCRSKAYQRGAQVPAGVPEPAEERFARAVPRPMRPEALGLSMMQALGFTDHVRQNLGVVHTEEARFAQFAAELAPLRATFEAAPGVAEPGFEASLEGTLFLKHAEHFRHLAYPRPGALRHRLLEIKNPAAVVDEVFQSVLSRLPSAEERAECLPLAEPSRVPELIWACLATAEFRFNH